MSKQNGLLHGEFLVQLPRDAKVVLGGHKPASSHGLIIDTPTAAEIIRTIAESESFETQAGERHALQTLAIQIAGRYSGHPIN